MSCKLRLFGGLWDSGGLNEKLGQKQSSVLSGKRKGGEVKGPLVKSCRTLRDHVDCSLPGSSFHGILQARILEWVAISFPKRPITRVKFHQIKLGMSSVCVGKERMVWGFVSQALPLAAHSRCSINAAGWRTTAHKHWLCPSPLTFLHMRCLVPMLGCDITLRSISNHPESGKKGSLTPSAQIPQSARTMTKWAMRYEITWPSRCYFSNKR